MIKYTKDGGITMVGADARTRQDQKEIDCIELDLALDQFLKWEIAPRVRAKELGTLEEDVWTDDLIKKYIALRNAARMVRPAVMQRIKDRLNLGLYIK
jgi:hypothetical protein